MYLGSLQNCNLLIASLKEGLVHSGSVLLCPATKLPSRHSKNVYCTYVNIVCLNCFNVWEFYCFGILNNQVLDVESSYSYVKIKEKCTRTVNVTVAVISVTFVRMYAVHTFLPDVLYPRTQAWPT